MTLREIARRVGVSPSRISQIEREKVHPSVSTLWGLVTVLGLALSDLFAESAAPAGLHAVPPPSASGSVTAPRARAIINLETASSGSD